MLIAALTFGPSDAAAQALTLDYQQVMTRTMPGASAAFALDPSRVGASAQNGEVTLVGRGPGLTTVIVVVGERTESLLVLVREPPTIVLPGMWAAAANNAGTGHYEVRYGSDPAVLQGNLRFARREGERTTELTLSGAAPRGDAISAPFSVPLASFTVRTPNREITLLDRVVKNSPLTIARANLRGLHWREGPWQVHAGYSFFGNFEHLLLPTNKESVAGIGYRHQLTPRSSLTPSLYYFDVASDRDRSGAVGTVRYEAASASDLKFAAELGISRTVAGAVEIEVDRPTRRAWAKLRLAPPELPSLTTDQQSGRQIEGGWIEYRDKSSLNAAISSRSSMGQQGASAYTSSVANVDIQRRLTPAWTVHAGSGYSVFENAFPVASRVHSITLPVGTSFSRRPVGFGLDYQFARETTRDLAGHLVRANLNGASRGFQFSLFGERQTHAPTVRQILTEVAWLQPMLDRLGLAAETPQQLADLLRTNAELSAYGYANSLQVDITPMRTRLGGNAGWSGSGALRPQLRASTLINREALIGHSSLSAVHSVSYSQQFGGATEVFFTWSALCHDRFFASASCRPAIFASLRRNLTSAPGFLTGRRGHIEGTVFQDDQGRGAYAPGMPTLAGVEVVLDSVRVTRSDRSGRFRFENVAYGRHRVEARYASDRPTFFTTPSPTDVDTGATVDFGIGRARSSLRGTVRTDAGNGLSRVLVHVAGADRQTTVLTADDGTFIAEGLPAGDYDVTIQASSVPAGYPVDTLAPRRVRVEETIPGRTAFVLRPYRSVSGRARLFNRESGQYVALAGTTVELRPLQRQSVTDGNGLYAFRDLPPGEYTVVAEHDGQEHVATVTVPDGPALVKDMDVAVVPNAALIGSVPLRARLLDEGKTSATVRGAPARSAEPRNATARKPNNIPPSVTPPAATTAPFTIQVAASTNARYAQAMVNELKRAGHAAYLVEPAPSGPGAPYHVRVGRYSTLGEANRSAVTLEKALGWRLSIAAAGHPGVQAKASGYVR